MILDELLDTSYYELSNAVARQASTAVILGELLGKSYGIGHCTESLADYQKPRSQKKKKAKKKFAPPGFEPGAPDSKSDVMTTTLWGNLILDSPQCAVLRRA